jgi:HNH endonuclease
MIDIQKHLLPRVPNNAATREHIIPRSYGGVTEPKNLVAACSQCNDLRGNMDYVAFSNLIRRWFKRDPTLRERWHRLSREERYFFRLICLTTHERQLRGLAQRHKVYAERHERFISTYGEKLQLRA